MQSKHYCSECLYGKAPLEIKKSSFLHQMWVKLHSYVLAFGLWDDTPHEKKKCPKTSNLIINDKMGFVNTIFQEKEREDTLQCRAPP